MSWPKGYFKRRRKLKKRIAKFVHKKGPRVFFDTLFPKAEPWQRSAWLRFANLKVIYPGGKK